MKILSLNTALLPPMMGGKDPIDRAVAIAKFILNYNKSSVCDFVALQEVYFDQARAKLVETLSSEYPHMVGFFQVEKIMKGTKSRRRRISRSRQWFVFC